MPPAQRSAPARAATGLSMPLVFVETADMRLQSRLACTSKVLQEAVQQYWRQTSRVADMKAYVEGIRCPVSRRGVLDDLLSVDPRRPVAPRPDWLDGDEPAGDLVYALANGLWYQLPVEQRDQYSLVIISRASEPFSVTRRRSGAFRDCLLNGLGRHLKKLELVMQPTMDALVADFVEGVQGGGLPSLIHLRLACVRAGGRTTDMLHSVCSGIPTLRRLELHQMGDTRGFEPSMRFPALRLLRVRLGTDDLAVAFAEAARNGGFPNLTVLNISVSDVGDALRHTRVDQLVLQGDWDITDTGANALLQDPDSLQRLHTLVLDSLRVTIMRRSHQ